VRVFIEEFKMTSMEFERGWSVFRSVYEFSMCVRIYW